MFSSEVFFSISLAVGFLAICTLVLTTVGAATAGVQLADAIDDLDRIRQFAPTRHRWSFTHVVTIDVLVAHLAILPGLPDIRSHCWA